eukprot:TRINITY_DN1105_c0_g1_i1.p1 TRINITY_DN1105_c0_g1~~TRINITY_DN1105_c0_g1_i1.p1  ORF type:complete len:168 (-),score=27.01 TRINITY_DN1105_c0_g1_i1:69-527(-)
MAGAHEDELERQEMEEDAKLGSLDEGKLVADAGESQAIKTGMDGQLEMSTFVWKFGGTALMPAKMRWQRRWFMAKNGQLSYNRMINDSLCRPPIPLAQISGAQLRDLTHLQPPDEKGGNGFTFRARGTEYFVVAETKAKAEQWVRVLNQGGS